MRRAEIPPATAATRATNRPPTTPPGLRGRNSWRGWARSFRCNARGVAATSGSEETADRCFLIQEHGIGDGFGVATSKDGVHWDDHGWAIRPSDKMVTFLGTGAVWKAPDFDQTGKFLCNYSEWRIEPETGRQTQNILFAWSTDLIHWTKFGDEYMFKVDQEHYDKYGRWDCIYPMPRAEGGYWGSWSATAKPGDPHQGCPLVRKYGLRLRTDLYADFPTMTWKDAVATEVAWAQELRELGYAVYQH